MIGGGNILKYDKYETENVVHLRYLDVVKGIAIYLVVLGHVDCGENFLSNWIYSFHIAVFFIVTGMQMAISYSLKTQDMLSYTKKKMSQLLYPYFVFSLLVVLYNLILVFVMNKYTYMHIIRILIDTITLEGYGTLWFLPTLFFAEIGFKKIHESSKNISFNILCVSVMGIALAYILQMSFWENNYFYSFLFRVLTLIAKSNIAISFIAIGYGFYLFKENIIPIRWVGNVMALLAFICNVFISQLNGWIDLHYCDINNPFLYYFYACLGGLSLIVITKGCINHNKLLEYFGKNSLIIMVTHVNFPILIIIKKIYFITSITFGRYADDIVVSIMIMGVEIICISIINRYLRFLMRPVKICSR